MRAKWKPDVFLTLTYFLPRGAMETAVQGVAFTQRHLSSRNTFWKSTDQPSEKAIAAY
jgi:hypothetical protein